MPTLRSRLASTGRRASGRRHELLRGLVALGAVLALVCPSLVVAAPGAALDGSVSGRVRASPIEVALIIDAGTVQLGRTLRAEARLINIGTSTIRGLTVELRSDGNGLAVKSAVIAIPLLKSGKSTIVTWSVCGRSPGSYVLLVRATENGASVDSAARLLLVTPGGKKAC